MTAICKFFKRATIIFDRNTWTASQEAVTLLHRLNIANWELSKIIIFDRNKKFLFELWNKLFQKLKIDLFYFTTYHSQTNEVFERTNQTFEIALRFHLQDLANLKNWSKTIVSFIQRTFNNNVFSIEKISNEICYDFTLLQSIDFLKDFVTLNKISKTATANAIVMIQMYAKSIYDFNHKELSMNVENWALLRLNKDYEISFIIVLRRKLSQQYVKLFKILQRIDNLAYKLNISHEWKIWSMIFIAQFELLSA